MFLARRFPAAQAMQQAGLDGLCQSLDHAGLRYQRRSLQPVLDWAERAATADRGAACRLRFACALDDDRPRKTQEIQAIERDIAAALARTPYVLLLSFPGINVVSAADFASEAGPIEDYANAKALSGRGGQALDQMRQSSQAFSRRTQGCAQGPLPVHGPVDLWPSFG